MINILNLVSYQVLPARAGGQRCVTLFDKYLSEYAKVICVSTRNNDVSKADGFQMLNILSNSPARYINVFYFFTLRRIIRQHRITHLMLEHPYYGWLAVLLKWFCGVKLVVRSQNIEGNRWKTLGASWWKLLWYYERWVHRRADMSLFIQPDDLRYGLEHFKLKPARCEVATYGIEWNHPPTAAEKQQARQYLRQQHNIPDHHHILLFNGAFNYLPNINGLKLILNSIVPLLDQVPDFSYTLLICGKDIAPELKAAAPPTVIMAGFVDDVTTYFKGADIFINPILEGGGIKTKLVEALGFDVNAVSTEEGAIGVDPKLCGGKLTVVPDQDLPAFVEAIRQAAGYQAVIPTAYFHYFYWQNIAARAVAAIDKP